MTRNALRIVLSLIFVLAVPALVSAQTVVDILPAPASAWGLEYHDGSLWVGDDGDGFIKEIDPADGTVLSTLPSPYDQNHITFGANHGVAWDGSGFWVAGDFGKDFLYKVDLSGAFTDTIPTPTDAVGGLGWNGTHLLVTTYFPNATAGILVVDPADGSIVGSTIPTQGAQPFGIVYDGGSGTLWNGMDDNDGDAERIYNLNAISGAVISDFETPAQSPKGIALGDGYMWVVANTIGGAGRRIYKIDLAGGGTPDITALPSSQDFGIVALGTTGQLSQTLRNDGDGDLVISNLSTAAPFSFTPQTLPLTITPGNQVTFDVFFDPLVAGNHAAGLVVESNDVDEGTLNISLAGIGVPQDPTVSLTPVAVNFLDTYVGLVRGATLSVENVGFDDLIVSGIATDLAAFELPNLPVFPVMLGTFETLEVQVVFRPAAPTAYNGTFTAEVNDPGDPQAEAALNGNGVIGSFAAGEVVWQAQGIENVVNVLATPDLNDDGTADAVMESYDAGADGEPFQAFYGNSQGLGVPIWKTGEGTSGGYGDQCLAVTDDLDGDTLPDIVRGTAWGGRRVEVRSSADGSLIWSYDTTINGGGGWVYSVGSVPDLSGDGVSEVIAGAGTNGGAGTGARRLYCFDGATGGIRFSLVSADAFLTVDWIDDVTGDGLAEVIGGAGGNGEDDRVYCVSGASFGTSTILWDFPTGGSVYSVERIADVNGDGRNDVVAGSWSNLVYCIDGLTGLQIWQRNVGSDVLRVEAIDDVTGDGIQDVAVAQIGSSFRVLDGATGVVHWVEPTGGNVWSVFGVPDVDGDGVVDVVAGCQDQSVYCVSGANGTLLWSTNVGALVFSVRSIPDVTGNGVDDIIAGTQFLSAGGGKMWCLEGGASTTSVDDLPPVAADPTGGDPHGVLVSGFAPNPLRTSGAFLVYSGSQAEALRIEVFEPNGRRVRQIEAAPQPGWSRISWDGRDAGGEELASGVYFFRALGAERGRLHGGGRIVLLR